MTHILKILVVRDGSPVWLTVHWHQAEMGKPTRVKVATVLSAFVTERSKPVAYLLTDALLFTVIDEWRDDDYFRAELNL